MLIFIDTEFTDFVHTGLISIALVSEDGREFYAELSDYCKEDCSDFVNEIVVPLLGRVPSAACSREQLTNKLRAWFNVLPEPATLVFDYFTDWELLCDAFLGETFVTPPNNVRDKLMLVSEIIEDEIFQRALNMTFTQAWPPHHALADARAIMAGYRAWRTANASKMC
jgi:hypothetical protein